METIQSFIMTVYTISIIFSIISSMVDISKFEKEFKFLFVGLFSLVLINSILKLDFSSLKDISIDINPYTENTDYTSQAVKSIVESSIKEYLRENNIDCKNISVNVDINENNSISINRVYLNVDSFEHAKLLILENFGNNIEVVEF